VELGLAGAEAVVETLVVIEEIAGIDAGLAELAQKAVDIDTGLPEAVGEAEPTRICHRIGRGLQVVDRKNRRVSSSVLFQSSFGVKGYYAFFLVIETGQESLLSQRCHFFVPFLIVCLRRHIWCRLCYLCACSSHGAYTDKSNQVQRQGGLNCVA